MENPDYIGLMEESKLIVQKENRLITLASSKLNLYEFKILDAFLSRIDSHKPEKNRVRFEKGDLEKILNKKRIRFDRLQENIQGLFDDIKIIDDTNPDGFVIISLFTKTDAFRDKDGIWNLDLECTDAAKEYFFNVEKFGYIKYMLNNISNLSSRASYLMYLMLESERNMAINYGKGDKIVFKKSIDDLKIYLNCDIHSSYNNFKYFNFHILKKCHGEINGKTSLKYDYAPVDKRGFHYQNIEFTIFVPELEGGTDFKALAANNRAGEQTAVAEPITDYKTVIFNVFEDMDLTMNQIKALNTTLCSAEGLSLKEAEAILKNALLKYTDQSAKQEIGNPYAYLSVIIKNQLEDRESTDRFGNMTAYERKVDLEKRLTAMKKDGYSDANK